MKKIKAVIEGLLWLLGEIADILKGIKAGIKGIEKIHLEDGDIILLSNEIANEDIGNMVKCWQQTFPGVSFAVSTMNTAHMKAIKILHIDKKSKLLINPNENIPIVKGR